MGICVPEKALHEAWRRADGRRTLVAAVDGDRYRVLYSGMPGGSFGPDFRDAVLQADDGGEIQGDVEIHRKAGDWHAHGHDGDEKYGRVVFHMVGEALLPSESRLNSLGMPMIEAEMDSFIDGAGQVTAGGGARRSRVQMDADAAAAWLDAAGDKRFALKINSARLNVEKLGPDLALQMAIFECLGYPRNRSAFRQLAKRAPWPFLARFAAGDRRGDGLHVEHAAEILHWAAGFGERPEWVTVPRLFGGAPDWVAAAGRPANRPEVRLKAAACFVARWWRASGVLRHVLSAMRGVRTAGRFRDAFLVCGGLVGPGRADEIVINGVLPTMAAWAEIGRDAELYAEVMRLYRTHPALPLNSVLEEAKRVLARRGVALPKFRGARQQQGAMHIYKSMLLRPKATRQMRLGRLALSS